MLQTPPYIKDGCGHRLYIKDGSINRLYKKVEVTTWHHPSVKPLFKHFDLTFVSTCDRSRLNTKIHQTKPTNPGRFTEELFFLSVYIRQPKKRANGCSRARPKGRWKKCVNFIFIWKIRINLKSWFLHRDKAAGMLKIWRKEGMKKVRMEDRGGGKKEKEAGGRTWWCRNDLQSKSLKW